MAVARQLYEKFLPPPPFRGVDPTLYEMRFDTSARETVRAWEAARQWAHVEPNAAQAVSFAERHLRIVAPTAMALYDEQCRAGVPPAEAMGAVVSHMSPLPARGQPGDLVHHPAPLHEQLAWYVATDDLRAICEFGEALGHHRDELWSRAEDLAVQERAMAARRGIPEGSTGVPAAAAAACLAAVVLETGEDIGTLSIALGVERSWIRGVLTGEVSELDVPT